jgi:hypothetical protein
MKGCQISALGNAQGVLKQKISVAPRIQNDQPIELFWHEIKINPDDRPFNPRSTSVWAFKVYLRHENSRFSFYTRGFAPGY